MVTEEAFRHWEHLHFTFSLRAVDWHGTVGVASLTVIINAPPTFNATGGDGGGGLQVSPSHGYAFDTSFLLYAPEWCVLVLCGIRRSVRLTIHPSVHPSSTILS